MDCHNVTMLDSQVVADDPVQADATIIKVVVGKNDEDGILSLLAPHKNCVAAEELERFHRVVGERNNGVIVIRGIRNPNLSVQISRLSREYPNLHQLVRLLLLLENGCSGIILLLFWSV